MYKRIIAIVLLDNGVFCRTRNFVADYHYTNNFIDSRYFDEMVFLDVSGDQKGNRLKFYRGIEEIVLQSQLPISIGGGIRGVEDIELFRTFGADRYVVNQTDRSVDSMVTGLISTYGKSSIISSINHWGPFTASRNGRSTVRLVDRIKEIRETCGGDILLNSIERDGTLRGLDLKTIDELAEFEDLSFILSGGLGNLEHLSDSLQRPNVVGVCTSNVYHLTTKTISTWRTNMISEGLLVRSI